MSAAEGRRAPAWQRPVLREDTGRHRPVGWVELFFDLVFVVVVAVLTADLEHQPSGRGVLRFVVQFVAVFWVWNGFTYYTERFESDGLESRVFALVGVLTASGLAVWGAGGLEGSIVGFALAYLVARGFNIVLWLRAAAHEPRFRPAALSFAGGYIGAALVLIAAAAAPEQARLPLFGLAVLVDIASPAVGNRLQVDLPAISRDKFPERFGLFTLIVLGEILAGIIRTAADLRGAEGLGVDQALSAVQGVVIGFALWWIYFDVIARRPPRARFVTALVWVYLHIAALAAAVVTGAAISLVIADDPAAPVPAEHRVLLLGGLGATLMLFSAIELTLDRLHDDPLDRLLSPGSRAVAGAALVVVGLIGPQLVPGAALACGLAVLALLVAFVAASWFTGRVRIAPRTR